MAETKKKKPKFVSPRGALSYAWLTTPDKKFEPVFGAFKTKLVLSPAAAAPLIEQIDTEMAASLANAKSAITNNLTGAELVKAQKKADKLTPTKPPYAIDEDTDNVVFSFSAAAGGINKTTKETWSRKISLFDAKGTPITGAIKIGNGSEAKISFEFNHHHIPKDGPGVKLQLVAVQIIKLVEWQSGTAAQAGFEAEEGYDSSAAAGAAEGEEAGAGAGGDDAAEAGEGKDF